MHAHWSTMLEDQLNNFIRGIKNCKVTQDNTLYDLQPGNATRYLVLFARMPGESSTLIMTITNFHGCPSMVVNATTIGAVHPSYVADKLKLSNGDAEPLANLIRWHLDGMRLLGTPNNDGLITEKAADLYHTPTWDPPAEAEKNKEQDAPVRFITLSYRECIERLGAQHQDAHFWSGYAGDSSWYLLDTKTNRVVGCDGGEPEDQLLVRDWAWVPYLLNKVANEKD